MIDTVFKFFTDNPIARWIAAAFMFAIGWTILKRHLKEAGRQAERAANAQKQAEARVAVNQRSTEILNEERHNADQAVAARDASPLYPTTDSMPDPIRRTAIRD